MAKRFVFRLEPVLKIRQRKLDEARRVVARRLRRIARIRDRIAAAHAGIADAVEQSRDAQRQGAPDVEMLRRFRAYIGSMHRAIAEGEAETARERDALQAEQEALTRANREVKALEKLRERQWERHRQDLARTERLENDEVALQTYRRSRVCV
jgi:flagellar FliJ protein